MRRLRRILFNAATLLSLVLCVCVVVLWVRSYSWTDDVRRWRTRTSGEHVRYDDFGIVSDQGRIGVLVRQIRATARVNMGVSLIRAGAKSGGGPQWRRGARRASPPRWLDDADVNGWGPVRWSTIENVRGEFSDRLRTFALTHRLVAALLAIMPGAWAYARIRRRHPHGHCPACGYDLRATPDRCPECGRTASPS